MEQNEQVIEQVKEKRKYSRLNPDSSKLMNMISTKGISVTDFAKNLECTPVTAKKIILNPLSLNGFERFKIAQMLDMNINDFTSAIDSDYKVV